MTATLSIDIEAARREILDPTRTVTIVRGAVDSVTLADYVSEAATDFERLPRVKERPEVDEGPDVVLPWVWDHDLKTFTVHRLYRFLHNEAGTTHGSVHEPIMRTRDAIEEAWPNGPTYEAQRYRNLHIIAKYEHGSAGYDRHTDVPFEHPHPMLQCWLQLTEPGSDFAGGDLILYPPAGGEIRAVADLGIRAGDVLFFDKRTEHEVTALESVEGGRGRWIAIVGAMATMRAAKAA